MRPMDPALVQIWHPTKNLPVMPSEIACQSNKKFWWKCEKGHEWQCDPSHLNKLVPLKRCPYCNDRAVCGDNSLLARYPEEKRKAAEAVLAQDPRPGYSSDPERIYGVTFAGYDIKFRVKDGVLTVCGLEEVL